MKPHCSWDCKEKISFLISHSLSSLPFMVKASPLSQYWILGFRVAWRLWMGGIQIVVGAHGWSWLAMDGVVVARAWVAVVLLVVGRQESRVWWSWVRGGVGSCGVIGSHGWPWVELMLVGLG